MPHQIVILGAGISGMAAAWYLKQSLGSHVNIQIIEKSSRAGGWIQTLEVDGFLFEQGPRSCRSKGAGLETLALAEALGLQDQVLVPHLDASNRYILKQGKLTRLPKHLWGVPFNPLTQGWLSAVWNDWKNPKRAEEDESIHSFFSRRLGRKWAEGLIDPFVSGIYAGDCSKLSIKSCFPLFDEWEQKRGSLIRGAWHHKRPSVPQSSFIQSIRRSPLFSFKEGMETLPRALAMEFKNSLILNTEVKRLECKPSAIQLYLENGKQIQADYLISTIPTPALGSLLSFTPLAVPLQQLNYATLSIVNLGFDTSVLPYHGFGYLVPSREQQKILGCVWDSSIFPQQNKDPGQTRLTVMMGGSRNPEMRELSNEESIEIALDAIHQHMGIRAQSKIIQVKQAKGAIPQFEVGYLQWKSQIQKAMHQLSPRLHLSGSAWSGVSINDCISHARQLAEQITKLINK